MQQRKVEKMIKRQKAVLDLPHTITKSMMWMGGMQILKKKKKTPSCEPKRKEWATHWQCDEEIQIMQK